MSFEYAIALTGGIGTGKSTTANLLKLYGYKIIDADDISHKILDEEYQTIEKMFGLEYVKNGKVLRKKLGAIIFGNKENKKRLEELLHPKIKVEILKQAEYLDSFKFPYFVDIPLFFETNNYDIKNSVLIYAPKSTQIQRVMKRDNIDEQKALLKIEAQMDIEEKKELSSSIIDNSCDIKVLNRSVEDYISGL